MEEDNFTSENDEENTKLIGSGEKNPWNYQIKDNSALNAIYGLNSLVIVTEVSIFAAILLLFIKQVVLNFPTYPSFIILLIGHVIIVFILIYICYESYQAIFTNNTSHDDINFFIRTVENEKRLILIQNVLYKIGWFISVGIIVVTFEILAYLASIKKIETYYLLIPLYIASILGFIGSAIFKSISKSTLLSNILSLSLIILINIKLTLKPELAWQIIFIPIYALLVLWFIIIFVLLINYMNDIYVLQQTQLEALICYIISIIMATFTAISFYLYSLGKNVLGFRNLQIQLFSLLIGLLFYFISYTKIFMLMNNMLINRMGGQRPQPLTRNNNSGTWDIDQMTSYENNVLLGEIDYRNQNYEKKSYGKSISKYFSSTEVRNAQTRSYHNELDFRS